MTIVGACYVGTARPAPIAHKPGHAPIHLGAGRPVQGYYTRKALARACGGAQIQRSWRCQKLQIAAASAGSAPSTVPITIKVKQHVKFGESLKLAGNIPELGDWDLSRAPEFKWHDEDQWTLDIDVPVGTHEYKLVIYQPEEDVAWWELGKNRHLAVTGAEEIALEFNDPALLTEDVEEISEISNEQLEATKEKLPTTVAETPVAAPVEAAAPAEAASISIGSSPVVEPVSEAIPFAEETVPDAAPVEKTVDKSSDVSKPVRETVVEEVKHEAVLPDPSSFNTAATPTTTAEAAEEKEALKSATPPPPPSKSENVGNRISGLKKGGGPSKKGIRATRN